LIGLKEAREGEKRAINDIIDFSAKRIIICYEGKGQAGNSNLDNRYCGSFDSQSIFRAGICNTHTLDGENLVGG
jgi:hypothetical protein